MPTYIIIDDKSEVVASIINDKKVGGNMDEVVRIVSACMLLAEEEADLKISPMLSDLADNDEEAVDITDNYEEAVDTGSSNLKFFRKLKDYPVVARASKLFDHK